MKSMIGIAFLVGAASVSVLAPRPLFAQACNDEETMVEDYKKSIGDLIETVKKESLTDFQKAYHQKNCLTKLTLCLSMVNGLVSCLDKAAQDSTATKEQVEATKAKREKYAKVKGKIEHHRDALKAAEVPKEAKALIEKFELSN